MRLEGMHPIITPPPPPVKKKGDKLLITAIVLIVLALGALATAVAIALSNRTEDVQSKSQTNRVKIIDNSKNIKNAITELKDQQRDLARQQRRLSRTSRKLDRTIYVLGKAGVNGLPGKEGRPGNPGLQGAQGPQGLQGPGPTDSQVSLAFTSYCASHICSLILTQEQANEALRDYCKNNDCRGADGKDAPPVTDTQLDARVRAYCESRGGCMGIPGPQGPQGEIGPQGPPGPVGPAPSQFSFPGGMPPAGQPFNCIPDPNVVNGYVCT